MELASPVTNLKQSHPEVRVDSLFECNVAVGPYWPHVHSPPSSRLRVIASGAGFGAAPSLAGAVAKVWTGRGSIRLLVI